MHHCSTAQQRVQWVSQMIASPSPHGLISQLSRTYQVSRQTLYRWKAKGEQALHHALGADSPQPSQGMPLEHQILTLLIEAHGSYRNIQTCLLKLFGTKVSLGRISQIVQRAGQRAQECLARQRADTPRALAVDEQYSSQRGKAYLNVIDVHSSQVWATLPPVEVDAESWMLVWWYLQEQGIHCDCSVSDGGRAIQDALPPAPPAGQPSTGCVASVSCRFSSSRTAGACLAASPRSSANHPVAIPAAGCRSESAWTGSPSADVSEHQALIERMKYVAEGVGYLMQELRTRLEVVVRSADWHTGVLSSQRRQAEIETVLVLLEELQTQAPAGLQPQIHSLSKHLRLALSHVLLFARSLDTIQQQATAQLGAQAVQLLGWAWQLRAILGPTTADLVKSVEPAWQAVTQKLLSAWDQAVRASSAVENWHSIVRPHLAVHHTLSAGMLALLAVWHNHHQAPRGPHLGLSPLQRTGSTQLEIDWLASLGYTALVA